MKKLLLFIILIILLFTIKNKQHIIETTNFNINDYIDTDFINNISKYPNFKKENLPKYYLQKDFTENYIYLLNKVNYPDFLKLNKKHQYIKEPIPLVTKKFFINGLKYLFTKYATAVRSLYSLLALIFDGIYPFASPLPDIFSL